MNRSDQFNDAGDALRQIAGIDRVVGQIATIAANDEARRILGVEGVLEGQLDLAFLNDPLEWLANDIANAMRAAEDRDDDTESYAANEALTLDIVVAEYRLCQLLTGAIDENELVRRVRRRLETNLG